ncbi:MAG: SRPBCC domain-containing protein [Actinobacteria bacterium]|nr:SRPBCC domain-containing protein [Actinomycetota bacterium]
MTGHRRIEREVALPAGIELAWAALSEPEVLSLWFGARVEIDLRRDGRATFTWPDGTERGAIVEDVEPARRLAFRWLPFERHGDGSVHRAPATRVELELAEMETGTRLRVTEAFLPGVPEGGLRGLTA